MKLRALNRILAKHETVYVSEVIKEEEVAPDTDENEEMKETDKEDNAKKDLPEQTNKVHVQK